MTNNSVPFRAMFHLIDSAKVASGCDIQVESKMIAVRDHFEEYYTIKVFKFGGCAYTKDFDSVYELYTFLQGFDACAGVSHIKKASDL